MNLRPSKLNQGRRRSLCLRILQVLLLAVGLVTLSYCSYVVSEAHFYQTYETWRLDQIRHRRSASTGGFLMNVAARLWNRMTGFHPSGGGERMAEGSLVGRITVPRLRLSSVVLEGDDNKVLEVAVGHVPGTALPGEAGNVALAGHRDTVFRELRAVHQGDTIALATPRGDYRYRVESVEVVSPDDVAVLKPTAAATLTLVTCYPFNYIGAAPWRFVVRAGEVAPVQTVAGVMDTSLTKTIGSSLPSALPGDSPANSVYSTRLHRARTGVRHKRLTRKREPADDLEAEGSPSYTREEKARGLVSRMRTEWSRLFERVKDRSSESP